MRCTRMMASDFFFQAEDGIRDVAVTGVQTCALPISGIIHPRGPHGAAQLPAKRFVPFPTTSLVLAAATTVARLVAAQPRRKDDLTHPVRSFLAQGETHRQPFRSPTRMLAPGPLTSSWASISWTVDATAPAVEHSRRRPQPRRP